MDRGGLKYQLVFSRGRCSVCKGQLGIFSSVDMHEAIITRREAQGTKLDIMVRQNCSIVHHGQCHIDAHTLDGTVKCIEEILLFEGDSVLEWLESLKGQAKSALVEDKIRLVKVILEDKK